MGAKKSALFMFLPPSFCLSLSLWPPARETFFIREIREIRGHIPLVAACRAGPFVPFRGYCLGRAVGCRRLAGSRRRFGRKLRQPAALGAALGLLVFHGRQLTGGHDGGFGGHESAGIGGAIFLEINLGIPRGSGGIHESAVAGLVGYAASMKRTAGN